MMTENQAIMHSLSAPRKEDIDLAQERMACGDPNAFGTLYDQYVQPIYRYLVSRLGDSEGAKDVTSLTFLAAFEAFPRYHDRGYFAAWLFSIARSKLIDYLRKEHRQERVRKQDGEDRSLDPLQEVMQTERIEALRALLNRLPEQDLELLRLRYVAGVSFADIAALLKRNEDAVKKNTYRLLARLHNQLEAKHE
jgi:RNA polymerase sigma-70 factor, ECF subfamily